jgi:phosphate:Na+ symporter
VFLETALSIQRAGSNMNASDATTILGGLGLFLLGIHHLTDGLKGLAGDSRRRALQTLVRGRLSAVVFGAVFTALIQSSNATILTVIGFVSAGLVTFSQAIGVLIGATFGTTTTPWMVAFFGFRVQISSFAMPILGVGAFLWLVSKGRIRAAGAILAGFGLIFVGLDYLQRGMGNISWNLDAFVGEGWASSWMLAGVGIVMTIVMQSSSAAAATDRKAEREKILEAVARQQTTVALADEHMDALSSADRALYHSWRLIDSLRIASQNWREHVDLVS